MEYTIIIILSLLIILILGLVFEFSKKKIEQIGMNEELNNIAEKYPENKEICKNMLKMLSNENVKIEDDENLNTSLYIALTNKIVIGNIKKSFSRIQTIAHECLHSVQNKKLLRFNFIYSNIYLLYFIISVLMVVLKAVDSKYKMLMLTIFIMLAFVFYVVRIFLENDAMIKAEFLTSKYLEKETISSEEEIVKLENGYRKLNDIGIKCVNYAIFVQILVKVIIFALLALIF
jgi:hypothetical protein